MSASAVREAAAAAADAWKSGADTPSSRQGDTNEHPDRRETHWPDGTKKFHHDKNEGVRYATRDPSETRTVMSRMVGFSLPG